MSPTRPTYDRPYEVIWRLLFTFYQVKHCALLKRLRYLKSKWTLELQIRGKGSHFVSKIFVLGRFYDNEVYMEKWRSSRVWNFLVPMKICRKKLKDQELYYMLFHISNAYSILFCVSYPRFFNPFKPAGIYASHKFRSTCERKVCMNRNVMDRFS